MSYVHNPNGPSCQELPGLDSEPPVRNGPWSTNLLPEYCTISDDYQNIWWVQEAGSTPAAPPPLPPVSPNPTSHQTKNPAFHSTSVITRAPPAPVVTPDIRPLGKSGKPKRVRTAFTTNQLLELEAVFKTTSYVSRAERTELSTRLGLDDRAIKVWFQNRRMKHKKDAFCYKSEDEGDRQTAVCSTTTHLPTEEPPVELHQDGYIMPTPISYDSAFTQAQETFNAMEYQNYNGQKQQFNFNQQHSLICTQPLTEPARINMLGTFQYDNISPDPQYKESTFSLDSTKFSAPYGKLPDSTTSTSITEDGFILNAFEFNTSMGGRQDDSGMASMNSESLDKLGILVSQCMSTDNMQTSSDAAAGEVF